MLLTADGTKRLQAPELGRRGCKHHSRCHVQPWARWAASLSWAPASLGRRAWLRLQPLEHKGRQHAHHFLLCGEDEEDSPPRAVFGPWQAQ